MIIRIKPLSHSSTHYPTTGAATDGDLDVEAAYARACDVMATAALNEDGREMMRAFLEKRPAVYPPRR